MPLGNRSDHPLTRPEKSVPQGGTGILPVSVPHTAINHLPPRRPTCYAGRLVKRPSRGFLAVLGLLAAVWLAACLVMVQPVLFSAARATVSADPAALQRDVRTLSEHFGPRDTPENLDRAAAWIRGEFEKTGARVREQTYEVQGRTFRNIIARFGSGDDGLLVVGAHYDAVDETPGADDNASGVAGLLELARLLGKHPPERPIELVAYTLEEPPWFRSEFMGSAVHARELKERGADVRGVIVLEMIGCFDDAWMSQDYPFHLLRVFYPSRGNFVAIAGRLDQRKFTRDLKAGMKGATSLPVWSINAPAALPGLDFSDHLNYWAHGWNAVMVTDTAFYRNKQYHQPGDTWDRLDYKRMADAVTAVHAALKSLP